MGSCGRFPVVEAEYSHASSAQYKACFPGMFLSSGSAQQLVPPEALLFAVTASLTPTLFQF